MSDTHEPTPETIVSGQNHAGLLVVTTSAGLTLMHPIEQLGVTLPERDGDNPREVDLDPSGHGLYIDAAPVTLSKLRAVCGA